MLSTPSLFGPFGLYPLFFFFIKKTSHCPAALHCTCSSAAYASRTARQAGVEDLFRKIKISVTRTITQII